MWPRLKGSCTHGSTRSGRVRRLPFEAVAWIRLSRIQAMSVRGRLLDQGPMGTARMRPVQKGIWPAARRRKSRKIGPICPRLFQILFAPSGHHGPEWQRGCAVETFKTAVGLIRALFPVIYFSGLLFYFLDVSGGSIDQAWAIGLGPTILGLGVVGLLFCIPLGIKIVRILNGPRAPGSGGGPGRSAPDDDDGFDADAVVARYMAQRPVEAAPASRLRVPRPKAAAQRNPRVSDAG